MAELLTYEELRAWAEKYRDTAFDLLPLSTSAARDASPMIVMRSLFAEVKRLRDALERIEHEEGYGESPAPVIVRNVREIARVALAGEADSGG